ncbi:Uncharacterized protein TCM_011832 [Theobroma cacao]|uniref:Uncharacterized protein n=1 Tax=Theobroma cacao TaxID=3641 RepID=A0A061EBT8_THECC|nr:Uncharacterized protein TCM_011832 [Theobroma cacao]
MRNRDTQSRDTVGPSISRKWAPELTLYAPVFVRTDAGQGREEQSALTTIIATGAINMLTRAKFTTKACVAQGAGERGMSMDHEKLLNDFPGAMKSETYRLKYVLHPSYRLINHH